MDKQIKEEKGYIDQYLKKYFDAMLIKDLDILKREKLPFTLPFLHLVNAGIDFLGGLIEGFNSNSKQRSINFIETWMGEVNELYRFPKMSECIYKSVRCGLSHQAILKKSVESYKGVDLNGNHLHIRINPEGKEKIFIHTLQYVDDFNKAQNKFRKDFFLEDQNIHNAFNNLLELKNDNNYDDLIENLKNSGYFFEEEISPSPSAAPDED